MSDALGSLQLQTLLSQTSVGIAATDAHGRMTVLSPALQQLFGVEDQPYDEFEMPERFRLFDSTGEVPLRPEEVPLVRARTGEVVRDALVTARVGERGLVHLRCNAAPLRDPDGNVLGAIVLVQDITSERAALREQSELRRRLVETVNHEFRTPLTTLFGHAELLGDAGDRLPPDLARSAEAVLGAAESLRDLVHTVSDLVDLGDMARVVRVDTQLRPLLQEVVAEHCSATPDCPEVVVEVDEQVVAPVDAVRLRRAVTALVSNATAHAPPHTEVRVRAWCDQHHLRIEIADHGSGIAAAERERLTEPFERGTPLPGSVSSRGLGLAVARTVAQAHGGTLELDEAEAGGLRATLVLPCQTLGGEVAG